ncbi:MAG: methyltransferase domain-containing protein [Gammaproteobacteria bacterium]|nr:MAG: methyltransferase domain-containing protein [Gammaproteobacteria bacterium]
MSPLTARHPEPRSLPAASPDALAAFNKAAGDVLRLTLLRVLRRASYSVMELCQILDMRQSALSHHLKVLAQADLVTSRREGNTLFYRRSAGQRDDGLEPLQQQLFKTVDTLELDEGCRQRVQLVQQERSASSREFFRENAHDFQQQQERMASLDQYLDTLIETLDALALPDTTHAVEVGPGEGHFLPVLSQRFARVTAIDNSPQMLARTASFSSAHSLGNVHCQLGEPDDLPAGSASCVFINMVLHHVAAPGDLLHDCAALLAPGGCLLVTELCPHEQEWAREACGDTWLGIEPDDLQSWASDAGLIEGQSIYLALRNGFRLQIRPFHQPNNPVHH